MLHKYKTQRKEERKEGRKGRKGEKERENKLDLDVHK